jgi:hypothetical protein
MRRLMPFLACLMLVLTGWNGMAHAAESAACEGMSHMQMAMAANDGCDQVQADADKSYPHHHVACHDRHLAIAVDDGVTVAARDLPRAYNGRQPLGLLWHRDDLTLRPPQA